jgi:hypothetical protein
MDVDEVDSDSSPVRAKAKAGKKKRAAAKDDPKETPSERRQQQQRQNDNRGTYSTVFVARIYLRSLVEFNSMFLGQVFHDTYPIICR